MGRYATVWLTRESVVYIQDNDLIVGPETITRMVSHAAKHPDMLVGVSGMNLKPDAVFPYTGGSAVTGPCDVVLGRARAGHRLAWLPGFRYTAEHSYPLRCDDIVFSMADGAKSYAIENPVYSNLDEESMGLSFEPQHFEERDRQAASMMRVPA